MISVHLVATGLRALELPPRTDRRLRALLLRSHIEELVEGIPQHLVRGSGRNRVRARLWSLLGDPRLTVTDRVQQQMVVRGLMSTYRDLSDVLHGRRVELSPDPLDLERWAQRVRAGCALIVAPERPCLFCAGDTVDVVTRG